VTGPRDDPPAHRPRHSRPDDPPDPQPDPSQYDPSRYGQRPLPEPPPRHGQPPAGPGYGPPAAESGYGPAFPPQAPAYGQPPEPYGEQVHRNPAYGDQTSHGAPAYGDQTYGGPAYGGPAYGGPAYGGPAYGGTAYGGTAYGEQAYGRQDFEPPPPDFRVPPAIGQPTPGQPYSRPPRRKQRAKRKSRLALALVSVLSVLVIVLGGTVGLIRFANRGSVTGTVDQFFGALQSKNVTAAHDLLCADGKKDVSTDKLSEEFELDSRTITGHTITATRDTRREGKTETLVSVTVAYDKGDPLKLDVGVWNESGKKICKLGPQGQ
jgi:hypothetical protein